MEASKFRCCECCQEFDIGNRQVDEYTGDEYCADCFVNSDFRKEQLERKPVDVDAVVEHIIDTDISPLRAVVGLGMKYCRDYNLPPKTWAMFHRKVFQCSRCGLFRDVKYKRVSHDGHEYDFRCYDGYDWTAGKRTHIGIGSIIGVRTELPTEGHLYRLYNPIDGD